MLERTTAVRVEPSVEAVDVDAAARDGEVAVEARMWAAEAPELTVGTGDGFPIAGEAVTTTAPAADGGAHHVNRSVGHLD